MRHLFIQISSALFLALPSLLNAQGAWQLISAQDFHQMKNGPEKTARIQALEFKDWFKIDTFYNLEKRLETQKIDLAPLVDDMGETIFLVTEISPEFPGGEAVQADYFQNLLGDLLAKPGESVQKTVFIKFTVNTDGTIDAVESVQPFPDWMPAQIAQRCLNAVKEMPAWSPGFYRNRPVKVKMLLDFSLRE